MRPGRTLMVEEYLLDLGVFQNRNLFLPPPKFFILYRSLNFYSWGVIVLILQGVTTLSVQIWTQISSTRNLKSKLRELPNLSSIVMKLPKSRAEEIHKNQIFFLKIKKIANFKKHPSKLGPFLKTYTMYTFWCQNKN